MSAITTDVRPAEAETIGRRPARKPTSWLLTVFVLICVGYFLRPLFWLVVASTKSNDDLFSSFGLWFANFNLFENIQTVLTFQDGVYVRWAINSVIYAVVTSFGAKSCVLAPTVSPTARSSNVARVPESVPPASCSTVNVVAGFT